jgi:hypothetical protein
MVAQELGRSVLVLTTDQSQLRQGLAAARVETLRTTEQIKRDSKIEFQVQYQQLRTAQQRILIEARSNKKLVEIETTFDAKLRLEQYREGLRQARREAQAAQRQMQADAQQGGLGQFGAAALSGAGVATGAGAVTAGVAGTIAAVKGGVSTVLEYNAAVESARAQVLGFTNDQRVVAQVTALANKAVDQGRGTFRETYQALADLTPLARSYNADLGELLKTAQILAAVDPAQGFEGASVALREALSGDFTSLTRRFEIPRAEIARLKAEGVPNLEIVKRALSGLGITDRVLTTQAQTFNQQLKIAADESRRFVANAGAPLFDLGRSGLGEFRQFLASDDVKKFGERIRSALADPQLQAGVKELVANLRDAAAASGELVGALGGLGGTGLVKGLAFLGTLSKGAKDLEERVTGAQNVTGTFIALLTGSLPQTVFAKALEDLQLFLRIANDPKTEALFNKYLAPNAPAYDPNAPGRNTGPGSFPQAGPSPSGGAGPSVGSGTAAPPQLSATVPETEAQFDISVAAQKKDKAERERRAFQAGQDELRRYVEGFTSGNFATLNAIQPQLQAAFDRLFGGLSADEQAAKGAGQISVLAARITDDIRRYGVVSIETGERVRAILGDQAADVLKLADAYARLAGLQSRATAATNAAAVAAGNLAVVRGAAAQAEATAQEKIAALEARARANATAAQNEARTLQERMDAVGREADRVARGYDEQLRGLQATLAAISRAADEAQRGFAEQARLAQAEQQAAQEAASRNAAAFAAVLGGTTEEYRRQNEQLTEQERRILALGDAALNSALKAKTAQDDKVQGLEVQQRAQLLALEERIRAARSRGGPQGELEARRLEAERDRLKAQSEYQLQLERQRAAVRGDEANTARKPVEEAAAAQAAEDKKRVDAAGARVSEIQEQARLRAEADRAAQQAIQDQITGVQEQARQAAAMYTARQQAIQDEIKAVQRRASEQALADDAAIIGAQKALDLVKKIEQSRIDGAKQGADNAQRAANLAKSEYDAQVLTLDILGKQNTVLNDRLKAFQDFIDKNPGILTNAVLNVAAGGAQGGARDNVASGLNPDGTPKQPATPTPGGGYTGKGASLRGEDYLRAYAPLPGVPTPSIAPIRFTVPAPPSLGVAAFAGGGAPAFARASGSPVFNINAPLASFPNATIRETVEVERAIRGGADLALRLLHDAQGDDDTGGGTLVGGR